MKFKQYFMIEIFSSLIGVLRIVNTIFKAYFFSNSSLFFLSDDSHCFFKFRYEGSKSIYMSLAIVFVKIVVSNASDFLFIMYAVALRD